MSKPFLSAPASALILTAAAVLAPALAAASEPVTAPSAQEDDPHQETGGRAQNLLFVELGGPGILYSVNYERLLSERFGLRVGASFFKFYDLGDSHASYLTVPMTGKVLVGPATSAHKLELELGGAVHATFAGEEPNPGETQARPLVVAGIGYRYAPGDGGFVFRATLTPMLDPLADGGIRFLPWAGLSFGYGL